MVGNKDKRGRKEEKEGRGFGRLPSFFFSPFLFVFSRFSVVVILVQICLWHDLYIASHACDSDLEMRKKCHLIEACFRSVCRFVWNIFSLFERSFLGIAYFFYHTQKFTTAMD